eukprot:433378_1
MYNEDDEGILDDWIDSLSEAEAIYYYNLLNGNEYDDNYDDYEEEEDPKILKEIQKFCKPKCVLQHPIVGLRKSKCKQQSPAADCVVQCEKDACINEYIKPEQGVNTITFECKDVCKDAVVLITGTVAGGNKLMATRASTDINGTFKCDNTATPANPCSPQFVGFYNLKKAEITGVAYLQNSQINFKLIDEVNIDISGTGAVFKDVSIYTEKVKSLTINVNQENSFQEILLDVRGVDGAVEINCKKKGACNKLVVRYQKSRCGKEETIKIKCDVADACESLIFIHESFKDKFGRWKFGCMWKKTVTPQLQIHPGTAFKDLDFKNTPTPCGSTTAKTIVLYDPHEKHNEGLYQFEGDHVCLKLTKDDEYNANQLVEIKKRNKGHNIQRTHGKMGQQIKKGFEIATAGIGVVGGIVGAITIPWCPPVGAAVAGVAAVLPLAHEAVNALILHHKNMNLKVFHIKWEDEIQN